MKKRVTLTGYIPADISHSIEGIVSIGQGTITNVYVNNVLVCGEIAWEQYCILDPLYGGFTCDGQLVAAFSDDDTWRIEKMVTGGGTTFNRCNIETYKRLRAAGALEPSDD